MGDEVELRDALTNLVFNAVDAMPEGGVLTLRTRADNGSVMVEVIDSGIGMDEETRRRCIEPFFTTKGQRGTGLGLASVYGMLQRHSATFEIDSAPGKVTAAPASSGSGTMRADTSPEVDSIAISTRSCKEKPQSCRRPLLSSSRCPTASFMTCGRRCARSSD